MESDKIVSSSNVSGIDNLLFEFERISIGINQYENIKCLLCYLIPFSPLFVNCCEQIICQKCFNDWKSKKDICPHCRNQKFEISVPNKFIKRIYSEIKYFCSFKFYGCSKDNLAYSEVPVHEKVCQFNPTRATECAICDQTHTERPEQNCLSELKEKNKSLIKKNSELEKELIKLKKEASSNLLKNPFSSLSDEYSYLPQTLKIHKHLLIKKEKPNLVWKCRGCEVIYSHSFSFYCLICDIDICSICFDKSRINPAKNYNHPHELSIKTPNMNLTCYFCDKCNKQFDFHMLRYRCQDCDFDLCHMCRFY